MAASLPKHYACPWQVHAELGILARKSTPFSSDGHAQTRITHEMGLPADRAGKNRALCIAQSEYLVQCQCRLNVLRETVKRQSGRNMQINPRPPRSRDGPFWCFPPESDCNLAACYGRPTPLMYGPGNGEVPVFQKRKSAMRLATSIYVPRGHRNMPGK